MILETCPQFVNPPLAADVSILSRWGTAPRLLRVLWLWARQRGVEAGRGTIYLARDAAEGILGVSTRTVRRALALLESMGWIRPAIVVDHSGLEVRGFEVALESPRGFLEQIGRGLTEFGRGLAEVCPRIVRLLPLELREQLGDSNKGVSVSPEPTAPTAELAESDSAVVPIEAQSSSVPEPVTSSPVQLSLDVGVVDERPVGDVVAEVWAYQDELRLWAHTKRGWTGKHAPKPLKLDSRARYVVGKILGEYSVVEVRCALRTCARNASESDKSLSYFDGVSNWRLDNFRRFLNSTSEMLAMRNRSGERKISEGSFLAACKNEAADEKCVRPEVSSSPRKIEEVIW